MGDDCAMNGLIWLNHYMCGERIFVMDYVSLKLRNVLEQRASTCYSMSVYLSDSSSDHQVLQVRALSYFLNA